MGLEEAEAPGRVFDGSGGAAAVTGAPVELLGPEVLMVFTAGTAGATGAAGTTAAAPEAAGPPSSSSINE